MAADLDGVDVTLPDGFTTDEDVPIIVGLKFPCAVFFLCFVTYNASHWPGPPPATREIEPVTLTTSKEWWGWYLYDAANGAFFYGVRLI